MNNAPKLRFVHLSDIHFSNRVAGFGFDPDRELRSAVARDIVAMRERLGNSDAVLISGDVAFAGKREEYEDAALWLDEVCVAAGCRSEDVFMCAGNHDVDQSVIRANPLIQDGHDAVRRGADFPSRDAALTQRLVQPEARNLFYSPMAAYNEFAARYQSSFFADAKTFVWERDFTLNDGSILRLRGLNTALLSGLSDFEGSLFLGSRAWTLPQTSGVEYMTMAHHPPSWLADRREAERAFESGARIQLFGHEHDQRVLPGRDWMKLFAGAINPHRLERNWKPGYNIIEVSVAGERPRRLKVEVHARDWQGVPPQFRSIEDVGHKPVHRLEIALADLPATMDRETAPTAADAVKPQEVETNEAKEVTSVDPQQAKEATSMDPQQAKEVTSMDPQHRFRLAVYRFFRLSLSKKNEIVGHLRLAEESDSRLTDVERFKLSLVRARERDQMDALEALICKLETGS